MNIQLIKYKKDNSKTFSGITVSEISVPRSMDEFDINIIDLSDKMIWRNEQDSIRSIDCIKDFESLQEMVCGSSISKIIYILPDDTVFRYKYIPSQSKYAKEVRLKDNLMNTFNIIAACLPLPTPNLSLVYENTNTSIGTYTYTAGFHFETCLNVLSVSNKSNKKTTIEISKERIYATSLQVSKTKEELLNFIECLFVPHNAEETLPDWLQYIDFGNDAEQREIIRVNEKRIEDADKEIKQALKQLQENTRYKSILYTNGDDLVNVVFEILQQLLVCDLSGFVDKKKEDFLIKKETCTFVGEIKGITSNVKYDNVAQVERHYQSYRDELEEQHQQEFVHQLLIINPFRTKEINAREPVHEDQIKLAKRNGCLIIETITLLKIFEQYKLCNITSAQCIDVFSKRTGLLTLSDFDLANASEDMKDKE